MDNLCADLNYNCSEMKPKCFVIRAVDGRRINELNKSVEKGSIKELELPSSKSAIFKCFPRNSKNAAIEIPINL